YEGDSMWKATIPQQNIGTQVSYTVFATDTVSNSNMVSSGYTIGREWGFDSNCVALISIDTPVVGALSGTPAKVYATIENRGLSDLTSAEVQWSVNGVRQSPVKWTGKLPEGFKTPVYLGTYMPTAGSVDTLAAWVGKPNGLASNNTSDTLRSKEVYACATILNGTYKVGPSGQFTTLNAALDVLRTCGATGNVVLSIEKGTYPELVVVRDMLDVFPGTDGLIIESATGKAEDVVFVSKSTDEPIVMLSNVRNLTLRNITFEGPGDGLTVSDSAYNVEVNGCRLLLDTMNTSTGYWGMAIYDCDANKVRFINNEIIGGYYSMYNYGRSSADYAKNVTVTGNRMHAAYYYGLYSYYTDYDYVSDNVVTNRTADASNYFYALRLYYSDADDVSRNRVNISAMYPYGLYTYYFNRDSSRAGLVSNNELRLRGTTTSYGAYVYYSHVEYIHNTIVISGTSTTAYGVYYGAVAGYHVHFYNNIFYCLGSTPYPFYMTGTGTVGTDLQLDYNNYYSPRYLGYSGAARDNLKDWITYSKDQNAVNVNPAFIDLDKDVRCAYYTGMNCPAVSNVPADILGNIRAGSTAMGCYE
ncbi:MAG: hypothetical protein J6T56_01615, partial [Bacteroidales bacterium]|nr:hypothetical protein [Bacteroidales bacterium]